ncbi:hypothetical protein LTR39_004824 [Cryomyces antarcticus]|nr:hypothetical protein LTR39_004824 [Cryomyces antarcticus]
MSSVPVLLCGKSPMLAQGFMSALSSTYDVVHVCHDTSSARREIPALLAGESIQPSSGLGSNANSDSKHRAPRAIIVGKGFSEDEVETMRGYEGADKVPWLVPDDAKMTWSRIGKVAVTAGTALPGIVADRVDACMKEHGLVPGNESDVKGGVWGF